MTILNIYERAHPISVAEQKIVDGKAFPLILSPREEFSNEQLLEWASKHKSAIAQELKDIGAIIFRGFPIVGAEQFQHLVEALEIENLPYIGGAAVRFQIYKGVHTTNESPPHQPIPFHHEMAQVPVYPECLFFYCDKITKGGETPILRSDLIYNAIEKKYPEFVRNLQEKGVIYTRVIPKLDDPSSPIGRGWVSTFLSDDFEEVKRKAKGLGVTLTLLENGDLKTESPILPAIKTLSKINDKKVWFNSVIAAYTGSEDIRNSGVKAVTYGDGTPLDKEHIQGTVKLMDELSVAIPWQDGDLMFVDNNQVLHSRKHGFTPPRKILAYLGSNCPY